jgi:hypothetical protein
MAPVLEGKSIGWDPKTVLNVELQIRRTKNQARHQGTVQLKHSICVKLVPRKLDPGPSSKLGQNLGREKYFCGVTYWAPLEMSLWCHGLLMFLLPWGKRVERCTLQLRLSLLLYTDGWESSCLQRLLVEILSSLPTIQTPKPKHWSAIIRKSMSLS